MSQYYAKIDCLACQDKFFVNITLMSKKMMSMLLTLIITFSVSVSLAFSTGRSVALSQGPNRKSSSHHTSDNPGQEGCIVTQNLMRTRCSFAGSIMKSHQVRFMTPNKKGCKNQHVLPAA
jgi:hypothetical protein